jgi:hypothetical protein
MAFPTIVTSSLSGRRMSLPGDLEGGLSVLLIALDARHQLAINSWVPYVKQLEQLYADLSYYELPVLGRTSILWRPVASARMRGAIPNPSARQRTVPLYVDRAAFCQALGLPENRGVQVLLMGRDGDIVWRSAGEVTPEKVQALAKAVADADQLPA